MKDRRQLQPKLTPAYEDSGLFKKSLVRVHARLMPEMQRTLRQDLMVRAFMAEDQEIIVIFAGRRTKQTGPLLKYLTQLKSQARLLKQQTGQSQTKGLMVEIEGSWRVKFTRNTEGWEDRDFQLVAARWRLMEKGFGQSFAGSLPVKLG